MGIIPFLLSFFFLLVASTYSYINSKTGILASVIVAFMPSGTQWGVGLLYPDEILWVSSLFLFFYSIPREILLDWLDMPGDRKSGKPSVPLKYQTSGLNYFIGIPLVVSASIVGYWIITNELDVVLVSLLSLTVLSAFGSFLPFFKAADRSGVLASIRFSHIPLAFLILALLSR